MARKPAIWKFWLWFGANPLWEVVRYIGGSLILTPIGRWVWLEWHRTPIDWVWLCLMFASGLILTAIASRKEGSAGNASPPASVLLSSEETFGQWNGFQTEQELREAERDSAIRTTGEIAYGCLSPHRMQAICAAIRINNLLTRFGEEPKYNDLLTDETVGQNTSALTDYHTRHDPWETKVVTAFDNEFRSHVQFIVYGFGNEGIADGELSRLLSGHVLPKQLGIIANRLAVLALNTEGLKLEVRKNGR